MSETELLRGRTKFVFGQKIDSIELRTTKMAGKGEAAINWKSDPAKPPYPFEAKEADYNESFRQKDSVLKSTTDDNTYV
jgi:hypothetical protein